MPQPREFVAGTCHCIVRQANRYLTVDDPRPHLFAT